MALEPWQPMLDGLYLWQVWDMNLPLSAWREELVHWLYVDLPTTAPGQPVMMPEGYTELCATYKLWMVSPVQMDMPLVCAERAAENQYWGSWGSSDPQTQLDQFVLPPAKALSGLTLTLDGPSFLRHHPGQTVALTTLIEYAVTTYGQEHLPVLAAGLGRYERWETLLPAVFGVSAPEFETGWLAYLTVHYGVSIAQR